MHLVEKIRQYGLMGTARKGWSRLIRPYHDFRCRNVPIYQNPTAEELKQIEKDLVALGVKVAPANLSVFALQDFRATFRFPQNYHGGEKGGVLDEKILEHFIAFKYGNLDRFSVGDVYVDVAGAGSPWARILRENDYIAYCVDLKIASEFKSLEYYVTSDAKNMDFEDGSVSACSLQCAYEMFLGNDDWMFLDECKRILKVGGKVVIAPLYMHTHHCGYSTPEHFAKGFADAGAKEYIRKDCFGIPFSRKYSPALLKSRVLDYVQELGMEYELLTVDNKDELGSGIYCHFILVITKHPPASE